MKIVREGAQRPEVAKSGLLSEVGAVRNQDRTVGSEQQLVTSLSRTKRCATCRKTEYEVEIRPCSLCNTFTYCSDLCEEHCKGLLGFDNDRFEATFKMAMIHDNYQALQFVTQDIETGGDLYDESDPVY